MNRGFTLVEALVAVALLGILASTGMVNQGQQLAQRELADGLQRLRIGLDRGRMAAERNAAPCGLSLSAQGWEHPHTGRLPGCRPGRTRLFERRDSNLQLHSNLPTTVRFTANGLLLDGGLVVLTHPRLQQRLCLVIGLPLGITRSGNYRVNPAIELSSSHCRPDDAF